MKGHLNAYFKECQQVIGGVVGAGNFELSLLCIQCLEVNALALQYNTASLTVNAYKQLPKYCYS